MVLGAGRGQVDLIKAIKSYGYYSIVASIEGNYPGFNYANFCCRRFHFIYFTNYLKKSADIEYPNKIREYLNVRVIFSYIIFFGATLCSILAYTRIPLSLGPILESSGYIFVAVMSRLFLKEKITKQKMLGLSIIIIGIIIYAI